MESRGTPSPDRDQTPPAKQRCSRPDKQPQSEPSRFQQEIQKDTEGFAMTLMTQPPLPQDEDILSELSDDEKEEKEQQQSSSSSSP